MSQTGEADQLRRIDFTHFRITGEDCIELSTTVDVHSFVVHTGYHDRSSTPSARPTAGEPPRTEYAPDGCGGGCC
ncbi:MAG TPA: hypothetical protein VHV82_03580 [Sporichthyaceae bacterium]|jgi:hypothetical protein|nr:hypothetical protein [Sporichthyaceae bacterium]